MRPSQLCAISILAILTRDTLASASRQRRRRGQRRRQRLEPFQRTKLQSRLSGETLRDRWVALLESSYDSSNAVRLESRREEQFYYSAEILADKLLSGWSDENDDDRMNLLTRDPHRKSASKAIILPRLWDTIAIGSMGVLALVPLSVFFLEIIPPSALSSSWTFLATTMTSIHSSITPHLIPTIQSIESSIKDGISQAQAIVHSLPYLLRHARRIKLVPLLVKVIRKCIILEAWRHIWIRLFKLSKRLWKGTLSGSAKAYARLCPGWIRRGIKSIIQSMVQAHVGSALGGVFAGSLSWSTGGLSGDVSPSDVIFGDGQIVEDALGSTMNDIPIDESLEAVLESTVDSSIDMVAPAVVSAVESAVESIEEIVDSTVADAISESVSSAVEGSLESAVAESVSECLESVVDSS